MFVPLTIARLRFHGFEAAPLGLTALHCSAWHWALWFPQGRAGEDTLGFMNLHGLDAKAKIHESKDNLHDIFFKIYSLSLWGSCD